MTRVRASGEGESAAIAQYGSGHSSLFACNRAWASFKTPDDPGFFGLVGQHVVAQVEALASNPVVREAWDRQPALTLHGRVYANADGIPQTVCKPVPNPAIPGVETS